MFGGKGLAGNCNKNELCGGDSRALKSAKIGHKLPRGNSKGLFSNVASNLLTTAIWIKRTIGGRWGMNNSYLKMDEIQVWAQHARLMYVIYVCTLTPRSPALRMVLPAQPSSPVRSDRTAFSTLEFKWRVINKYMFPLNVGVFATPPQLARGRIPPQRAGRGCAGRSALLWDWAPLLPASAGRTPGEKNPALEKVGRKCLDGLKQPPLGKH